MSATPSAQEIQAGAQVLANISGMPAWWGGQEFLQAAEAVLKAAKEASHA